jgi:hypothetical protein
VLINAVLGFWTLPIVQYSKNQTTQRFGNWICFHSQVREETPTLLGLLEIANLNRWTVTHHHYNPLESTPHLSSFVCDLFNDTVSNSNYIALNDRMISEE